MDKISENIDWDGLGIIYEEKNQKLVERSWKWMLKEEQEKEVYREVIKLIMKII